MKQITKKQCEEALELAERCEYWYYEFWDKFGETEEYDVLEQLIKEHFDNPPLKFEELKEGMLVWDNKFKEWCLITIMCKYPHKRYFDGTIDDSKFEEGRFFRKQVEE